MMMMRMRILIGVRTRNFGSRGPLRGGLRWLCRTSRHRYCKGAVDDTKIEIRSADGMRGAAKFVFKIYPSLQRLSRSINILFLLLTPTSLYWKIALSELSATLQLARRISHHIAMNLLGYRSSWGTDDEQYLPRLKAQ